MQTSKGEISAAASLRVCARQVRELVASKGGVVLVRTGTPASCLLALFSQSRKTVLRWVGLILNDSTDCQGSSFQAPVRAA